MKMVNTSVSAIEKPPKNVKKAEDNELIMSQFTKAVFWNCDLTKFDYKRDKDYIIKRILEAGFENDEFLMWKLYSYDDIKNVAVNMETLDEDMVAYMAFVLSISQSEFRCYKKKPWYRK